MGISKYVSIGCAIVMILTIIILWMQHIEHENSFDKGYKVWWNVPTEMCHKYGLNFSEITNYGLVQNINDKFLGDQISILYDPGAFPSLENGVRNGGVPQEGNLKFHLKEFKKVVDDSIPEKEFSGLGIIDFEDWRPIWRENWGKLDVYREKSIEIEKKNHPGWPESKAKEVAIRRFEKASYTYFEDTLDAAKSLRPLAKWGYYGYPFCFNFTPKNQGMHCSSEVQKDNDRSTWLEGSSTAFYPSIYLYKNSVTEAKRPKFIEGRLKEALRIAEKVKPNIPVIPYATFKYPDSASYYSKADMSTSILLPKKLGASGVIIWGSSKDTSSKERCLKLLEYAKNVIKPIVKQTV